MYRVADENLVDLFFDEFDAVELTMLYGIFARSAAKIDRLMVLGVAGYRDSGLDWDMHRLELGAYGALMHKCGLISEQEHYMNCTMEIMGERPRHARARREYA